MGLFRTADSRLCSGTTIAKVGTSGILLTAAHCVVRLEAGGVAKPVAALPPSGFLVLPGTDWYATYRAGRGLTVTAVAYVPAYDGATTSPDDLALVRYTNAPAVTAIPFLTPGEDRLAAGDVVTLVGYGRTGGDAGTNLERRKVEKAIESLTSYAITISQTDGKGACQGDSGGPALRTTPAGVRVAGVTSYGDLLCVSHGGSVRVSAHAAFIQAFIANAPADAGMPPPDAPMFKDAAAPPDAVSPPDSAPPTVDAAAPPLTCGKVIDPRPACAACVATRCCFEAKLCEGDPLCRGCGTNPLASCYLYPPAAAFAECLATCVGNPCGIVSQPKPEPVDAGAEVATEPPAVNLPMPIELPDAAPERSAEPDAASDVPAVVVDAAAIDTAAPPRPASDAADGAPAPADGGGDARALATRAGCGCDTTAGPSTERVALLLLLFAGLIARRRRVTMPRNER